MIIIIMILTVALIAIDVMEAVLITNRLNSFGLSLDNKDKTFEENVLEVNDYLLKDRQVIVNKLNESRIIYKDLVEEQHFYDDKITELNNKLKSGVDVDEAEEISSWYKTYNDERKETMIECKKYKQEMSHLSHVLSIIDAKLV